MSKEWRARVVARMLQHFTVFRMAEELYACGYQRGYDVATARAESRAAAGPTG
jgi:hypothetical protein